MNPIIASALSGSGSAPVTNVDTVFSINTRAGTGASATITNGINLSGNGGLVIMKGRSGATNWAWYDTVRGATKDIASNDNTSAQTTEATGLTAFSTTGFTIGALAKINTSSATYVDYTFREAAGFLDIVTYAGSGSSATINHSLGATPGLIIVKGLTGVGATGAVYSRALAVNRYMFLSGTTAGGTNASLFASTPTSSSFFLGPDTSVNNATETYIAYVFGHDASANGIIFSDTFTVDGSGNATVNIGWEPQFVMVKASSTTGNWIVLDNIRGFNTATTDASILINTAGAETTATDYGEPTATGFNFKGGTASASYVYLAVRKQNVAPTSGTQVFTPAVRTGTGATSVTTAAGFAPDLVITKKRSSTTLTGARFVDRLRGKTIHLDSSSTAAEVTTADTITALDSKTGVTIGADATTSAFNTSAHTYVDLYFKRAQGVFDIVAYKGTGASNTVAHSLGVVPEMIIVKHRGSAQDWPVYHAALTNTSYIPLNLAATSTATATVWNNTSPTSSVFTVNTSTLVNTVSQDYIAYLFASLAGVSKVGSYVGNGTSTNVDCGFAAGARFVMIKQVGATDWFVFDTARGIVAGNDPRFSMNTTAAEVTTDDSIDPLSSGFTVNQLAATNINVNATTYLYLAIA